MNVLWARPALHDLEDVGDHIAARNPAAAARTVARILSQVDALASNLHRGRRGRVVDTRKLVVTVRAFIVPYRFEAGAHRNPCRVSRGATVA